MLYNTATIDQHNACTTGVSFMNIFLITTYIDRSESEMFCRMQQQGHQVVAIVSPETVNIDRLKEGGIEVHIHKIGRIDKKAVELIKSITEKYDFEIVHILRKHGISSFFKAVPHPKAKVVAYRGIIGNLPFYNPFAWMTFLNPKLDRVICVCEAIRKYFLNENFVFKKFPAERYITIHKGHDIAWYDNKDKDSGAFDNVKTKLVIGCVARMVPRKGVPYLIEAFDMIADKIDVSLMLVGVIHDKKIHAAIARSPYKDRIIQTGFRTDAPVISGKLDITVLPTLKREGLPRSVIEAMAQGVPAVVTTSGGSPEIVENEKSGYVVPTHDAKALANALSSLLNDDKKRLEFSENAQKRIVDAFNVEQTLEKTLNLYKQLLN
jgi:glycosyltransferase involved in cell wall biosynthesis